MAPTLPNNQQQRLTQFFLLLTILLIALTLRPSIASVGPILPDILKDIALSYSQASLLTTLPVMAIGIGCFAGFTLARRLGMITSISCSLILLCLATLMRYWVDSASWLIFTAVASGLGIAFIQAIMPAIIKQHFHHKAPIVMGVYTSFIMAGAAFSASLTPYFGQDGNWQQGLGSWGWLILLALSAWCLIAKVLTLTGKDKTKSAQEKTKTNIKISTKHSTNNRARTSEKNSASPFWRNKRAWKLAAFLALINACYVCLLAWLAPYAAELGYSNQEAGLLVGVLTTMEVVAGLLAPFWVNSTQDRRAAMAFLCVLQIVGLLGLSMAPQMGLFLWSAIIGLGIGGLFSLAMIVTMEHQTDALASGKLMAFVQGVGYLVAGVSPWIAGSIRDQLQSFTAAWQLLILTGLVALVISLGFNPRQYQSYFKPVMSNE